MGGGRRKPIQAGANWQKARARRWRPNLNAAIS
jgi:hypothetical protein